MISIYKTDQDARARMCRLIPATVQLNKNGTIQISLSLRQFVHHIPIILESVLRSCIFVPPFAFHLFFQALDSRLAYILKTQIIGASQIISVYLQENEFFILLKLKLIRSTAVLKGVSSISKHKEFTIAAFEDV